MTDSVAPTPHPDLKIISSRVFRGPNLWHYEPAIQLVVDLGVLVDFPTNKLSGFADALLERLPGLVNHTCSRGRRGGFVELALRTGAPIVPVAVVGSEEIYPKLGEVPQLARLIGAPFVPVTPTFPWLGPLGLVPLPSKWRIEFCEPIETASYGPEGAEDRALVLELSERVRATIQAKLYENVVKRGPAFV